MPLRVATELGAGIHPTAVGQHRRGGGGADVALVAEGIGRGWATVLDGPVAVIHPAVEGIAAGPARLAGGGVDLVAQGPNPRRAGAPGREAPAVGRNGTETDLVHLRVELHQAAHPQVVIEPVGDRVPVVVDVHEVGEPELAEVADALDALGAGLRTRHRWKQQAREHGDDRDHHQQFHQCESAPCRGLPVHDGTFPIPLQTDAGTTRQAWWTGLRSDRPADATVHFHVTLKAYTSSPGT